MVDLAPIVDDLAEEHAELDGIVAVLAMDQWDLPTPAEGWTIRDQISHLAFFDEQATLAATDPTRFTEELSQAATDVDAFMNDPLRRARKQTPPEVLAWWRNVRAAMVTAFRGLDRGTRIPWFGPPMSPASFVSARLMETWAHGQDVVDTLGLERTPTERLRHIAHLGVRARPNSYAAQGRELPSGNVLVRLTGPSGDGWVWNEDANDHVSGPAVDFCLVVTQRRHPADTGLLIEGPLAEEWMSIAQAFAGPPGSGRKPGQFPKMVAR